MKILFLIDEICIGGMERRMIELIKGLLKLPGYEIALVSFTPGAHYKYLLDLPIQFNEIQRAGKRDLSMFFSLYKIIRNFKPDIIHSWGSMSSVCAVPSLFLYRSAKFINGFVGDAPVKRSWGNKHYFRARLTFPFSDAIVGNSFAGLSAYKVPAAKAHCFYNGLDPARFVNLKPKQELKDIIGIGREDFVVGMVAIFEERKDHETIIRAAQLLQQQQDKIKILLVGGGSLREQSESLAQSLDLKNTSFLGHKEKVEDYIQLFDIGVLTTNSTVHGEGISNALIECMALGKPVIGTAGGGTNELIEDGSNGFLIPPRGHKTLAEKILYLFDHRQELEKLGRNAANMASEKFTLERMTRDYIDLYNRV